MELKDLRQRNTYETMPIFGDQGSIVAPTTVVQTPKSLSFDGSNDKAQIGNNALIMGMNQGSIELFFKSPPTFGAFKKLVKMDAAYDIGITSGGDLFGEIPGVKNIGVFKAGVSDDNWHHAALCWDTSNLYALFDGTRISTTARDGGQGSHTNPCYIGHAAGSEYFDGKITLIRISNVCRYNANYSIPSAVYTVDANTRLMIPFYEGSGATAADQSGNAIDLALDGTNPPAWSTDVPF